MRLRDIPEGTTEVLTPREVREFQDPGFSVLSPENTALQHEYKLKANLRIVSFNSVQEFVDYVEVPVHIMPARRLMQPVDVQDSNFIGFADIANSPYDEDSTYAGKFAVYFDRKHDVIVTAPCYNPNMQGDGYTDAEALYM
jgi:hypothetical protein